MRLLRVMGVEKKRLNKFFLMSSRHTKDYRSIFRETVNVLHANSTCNVSSAFEKAIFSDGEYVEMSLNMSH